MEADIRLPDARDPRVGVKRKRDKDEDIDKKLKVRKEKKDKKTKLFNLIAKKRKVKAGPSEITKIVNELTKKNISDPEKIRGYVLGTKGKEMSVNNSKLYSILVQSKVAQNKIILSDRLNNTPLYSYFFLPNSPCQAITNDWLILQGIFYYNISQYFAKKKIDRIPCAILRWGKVVKVTFSSDSFIMDNGVFKKGYYQDNSDDFGCVGLHELPKEERDQILAFAVNRYEFGYRQKDYVMSGNEKGMVAILKNFEQREKILLNYNAVHVFSVQDKFKFDPKLIDNNKKIKYLYFTLNSDVFCPAFLILPDSVESNILFKIELDYNHMSDMFMTAMRDNVNISDGRHAFCYWDTVDEFIDFLSIFVLVHSKDKNMKKEIGDQMSSLCDHYYANKPIINHWKNIYTSIEKALTDFYSSFEGKIKIDNLNKVNQKILEIRTMYNEAKNDTDAENIITTFSEKIASYCYFIKNQVNYNFDALLETIYESILKLNRGNIEGLPTKFREVGKIILKMGFNSEEAVGRELFPFCFSKGGYLGNLSGKDEAVFDELLLKVKEKILRKEEREVAASDVAYDAMEDFNNKCLTLITNSLIKRMAENKISYYNINESDRNIMLRDLYNELNKDFTVDKESRKYLYDLIAKWTRDGKDFKLLVLPTRFKNTNNLINDYCIKFLNVEEERLKKEAEVSREAKLKQIQQFKDIIAKKRKSNTASYFNELMMSKDANNHKFSTGGAIDKTTYRKFLEWYKYFLVYGKFYPEKMSAIQASDNLHNLIHQYPVHPFIIQDVVTNGSYPEIADYVNGRADLQRFDLDSVYLTLNKNLLSEGILFS